MTIGYIISLIFAVGVLVAYLTVVKNKEFWLTMLYICVTVVNLGYTLLSMADTLNFALLGNDVVYLGSVSRCSRIELRQIGVRDETGIYGGIGVCGQVLCCSRFLKEFNSINVKMAKEQDLSLTPATISGACGRLKCCLKYEHKQKNYIFLVHLCQ